MFHWRSKHRISQTLKSRLSNVEFLKWIRNGTETERLKHWVSKISTLRRSFGTQITIGERTWQCTRYTVRNAILCSVSLVIIENICTKLAQCIKWIAKTSQPHGYDDVEIKTLCFMHRAELDGGGQILLLYEKTARNMKPSILISYSSDWLTKIA